MNAFINAVLMVAIAVVLAVVGPEIDRRASETPATQDAIEQANKQERFERAAQQACGMNSAWKLTDVPGQIVCLSKKGKRMSMASL